MSRLLIVDDDRVGVSALAALLEDDGYQVVALTSSAGGLEALSAGGFDAVITDLEMPGLHGLELVRAIRECSPTLPILIVTGYTNSPAAATAVAYGARRVFPKPVPYEDLLAELGAALPH